MITWISGNAHALIATLSSNAITLNQNATQYFNDVKYVQVGIDAQHNQLVIHPVSKEEIQLNLVQKDHLHKISIGNSYSKITNKALLQTIQEHVSFPLNNTKFYGKYDEKNHYFYIDLQNQIQRGDPS